MARSLLNAKLIAALSLRIFLYSSQKISFEFRIRAPNQKLGVQEDNEVAIQNRNSKKNAIPQGDSTT